MILSDLSKSVILCSINVNQKPFENEALRNISCVRERRIKYIFEMRNLISTVFGI